MGISTRTFLLTKDDRLYLLPTSLFEKMLAKPAQHPLPRFAGQRIRMAEVLVQLRNRRPSAIARTSFHILSFDARGCFDAAVFLRQEFSRAEVAISPVLIAAFDNIKQKGAVVEAAARFRPAAEAGNLPGPSCALYMMRQWEGASSPDCEHRARPRQRKAPTMPIANEVACARLVAAMFGHPTLVVRRQKAVARCLE